MILPACARLGLHCNVAGMMVSVSRRRFLARTAPASALAWAAPAAALLLLEAQGSRAEIKVASNFESGSARVTEIDQAAQRIRFQPAGNPARGWPNWWFLRVDGADPDRPVLFELRAQPGLDPKWTMPTQAAFSANGTTWVHTARGERRGNLQTYRVQTPSSSFWLAWGPPFTVSDAWRFARGVAASHSFATAFELCKSREGRSVPALQIAEGGVAAGKRPGVRIVARQHAWEVGGSWVARGLIEWLVGPDEGARWLRQHAEVFAVPIVDADRVATGDGGKKCKPHDHNLDWSQSPLYTEVAAAQRRILALLLQGRMDLLLDLHNPGPHSLLPGIYVTSSNLVTATVARRKDRFVAVLREQIPKLAVIDDHPKPNNPADLKDWRVLTTSWLQDRGNPQTIGFAIETPWNTPQGTVEGHREMGRKLGRVMEKYLRGLETH